MKVKSDYFLFQFSPGDKASQARWAAYKAKRAAKREASEKAVIEDMNRRLEQQQKELDALKAKMM